MLTGANAAVLAARVAAAMRVAREESA